MTGGPALDDIDRKILSELQNDGRIRINELASRVGLSLHSISVLTAVRLPVQAPVWTSRG